MRWFLVIALFAILVSDLWIARRVSYYEVSHVTIKNYAEQKAEQPTEGPFVVLANGGVRWLIEKNEAITALSTLVIAIFAVVLAQATIGLKRMADRQADDMMEALAIARNAAQAARESASAAKASVDKMDETARKELRAYIGIPRAEVTIVEEQKHIQAWLEHHNVGRTPARNVVRLLRAEVHPKGFAGPFPLDTRDPGRTVLAPGASWTDRLDLTEVTTPQWDALVARSSVVFVWGVVDYEDIYDVRQQLTFRFRTQTAQFQFKQLRTGDWGNVLVGWDLEPEDDGNAST